jgi:enoyl ACP reductase
MSVTDEAQSTNGAVSSLLEDKKLVVTGVITRSSIAYSVASLAQQLGADVVLTSFGRAMRMTERAAATLPRPADVLELDVDRPEDFGTLRKTLDDRWGRLDGVVHAIAHAPSDALGGAFMTTPAVSAASAFHISAYSLAALGEGLRPLLEVGPGAGSIVALDFDASVAWPGYDWMGVAKGALESVARYMAMYMGDGAVRVNLVSAGPLKTVAASGVPAFQNMTDCWAESAPLGWSTELPSTVAGPVCFLLSDLAAAVTGEIIHADGGFHAIGGRSPASIGTQGDTYASDRGMGA